MSEKYIYLGEDLQLKNIFLKKNMVISFSDLKEIEKINTKAKDLFINTKEFPKFKSNLAFYSKKIEKTFQEVLNGI
ncbi:hypothetical protein H3N56_02500 [Cetobacterium sp. 2A]|uniref:hypothetical protein n=1 Tax=Cetobacterium sp. 2A TaxID=2754723 RepID=UPI00163CD7C3|nr:hypothetical protein [Cetobacterium sp. 2A]MBC2855363.1 hypothetical protein [Cetobacterium sp. 2A]